MRILFIFFAIIFALAGCTGGPDTSDNCQLPSQLIVETTTPGESTISWSEVTGASGYTVEYKPSTSFGWAVATTAIASSPFIINLIPERSYDLRLKANCAGNSSAYAYRKLWYETVHITSSGFNPSTVTLTAGSTIGWKNDDAVEHAIAIDSGLWTSINIMPGSGIQFSTVHNGMHPYHCALHPGETGMFQFLPDTP